MLKIPYQVREFISQGQSGAVGILVEDETQVLKFPIEILTDEESSSLYRQMTCDSKQDIEREKDIYLSMKPHPNIVKCLSIAPEGIYLERLKTPLEARLRDDPEIPQRTRLAWAWQLTNAVAYLDHEQIHHCDLCLTNCLLDTNDILKLCDFGAATRKGSISLMSERTPFCKPDERLGMERRPDVYTEQFALGSCFYAITTGTAPYATLDEDEVETRFRMGIFPSLEGLALRSIIQKCWLGKYHKISDILQELSIHTIDTNNGVSH
ncbi:hypothetical protein MMC09_006237 [Bachmanniomyces sp. S44760]|nr:hypothetical protein [Bachmanniomyces sp. S44760]